jgi:thiamine biosynthesis lipoprotein
LVLAGAAGACLTAWPPLATPRAPERLRVSRPLMGTRVDIAAQAGDAALLRAAADAAFARMAALAAMMSHYSATSRVAAINHAAGLQAVEVPRELMQVLRMARDVSARSDGAFDITIGSLGRWHFEGDHPRMPAPAAIARQLPLVDWRKLQLDEVRGMACLVQRGMRLDVGGIAKLPILQAGLDTLRAHGVQTALVNGGGDVVAITAREAPGWRVGIRDPRDPARLAGVLPLRQGFVASSGDYERFFVQGGRRYHHVLDPRTGESTQGVHGVTLVSEALEAVNGIGAALMVLGEREGRELLRRTDGVESLIATREGNLRISARLQRRLVA